MKNFLLLLIIFLISDVYAIGWPDGPFPCNNENNLEDCIIFSTDRNIFINTNDPINETIDAVITNGLNLQAGEGFSPTFSIGNSLSIEATGSVVIKKLKFNDGYISVYLRTGTPAGNIIEIKDNDVTTLTDTGVSGDPSIYVTGVMPATISSNQIINEVGFGIFSNRIRDRLIINDNDVNVDFSSGIVASAGGSLGGVSFEANISIYGNKVILENDNSAKSGIAYSSETLPDTSNLINIFNNFVSFKRNSTGTLTNDINGIGLFSNVIPNSGENDIRVVNNTVINLSRAITIWRFNPSDSAFVDLHNNIFLKNDSIVVTEIDGEINSNATNLIFDNISNGDYVSDPTDLIVDPQINMLTGRQESGSPVIDAGGIIGALYLAGSDLEEPLLDADGLYRTKGDFIDIGAFEFGNYSFDQKQQIEGSHILAIDHDELNGNTDTLGVHTTLNLSPANGSIGYNFSENVLLFYVIGQWKLISADPSVDFGLNTTFNILKLDDSLNVFEHDAIPLSISGSETVINRGALNNNPDAILQVIPKYDVGPPETYNNHTIGVRFNTSENKWVIYNQDGTPMAERSLYNIYFQDRSNSAWEHQTNLENIDMDSTYLDNHIINDNYCAQIQVTQVSFESGPINLSSVGVAYDDGIGRWRIFNTDGSNMTGGLGFHVLVIPEQAENCDLLFSSDFD